MRLSCIFLLTALVLRGAFPVPAGAQRGITTAPEGDSATLRIGRQYLVVIAVSDYRQWPPLAGPVPDALEIKDILVSRYRIDRLFELYDEQATKASILRLLVRLQKEIEVDDSLLILYAGHGHLDPSSGLGFWIPANAGTDVYAQENWLPHTQLRGLLANIRAAHLFVISDSCFAGDLIQATRSLPEISSPEYLLRAYAHVCRQVLTSGATEAVPDASAFARQLKSVLSRNQAPYLDAYTLYSEIRLGAGAEVPLLGSLAGTGHQEGGGFLLFLRPGLTASPELLEPLQPPGSTAPGASLAKRTGRFSVAAESGCALPLAAGLREAPVLWTGFQYRWRGQWWSWGFGLLAGSLWSGSDSSIDNAYSLRSYPVALELQFLTHPGGRVDLAAGLAVGAAFNRIRFEEPAQEGLLTAKALLAPRVGIGWRASRRLRLIGGARLLLMFFDGYLYTGLSPEAGVEYAF